MIPRLGEPVRPGRKYRPRPGAYVILQRDGLILLTHQRKPQPEFQLPGGGIDAGESPVPALHREVIEETGWTISRPRRLGAYRRFTYMPEYRMWAEKVCTIYAARPVTRISGPLEEHHTAVWMPVAFAVESIASKGDREFVRQFFKHQRR